MDKSQQQTESTKPPSTTSVTLATLSVEVSHELVRIMESGVNQILIVIVSLLAIIIELYFCIQFLFTIILYMCSC